MPLFSSLYFRVSYLTSMCPVPLLPPRSCHTHLLAQTYVHVHTPMRADYSGTHTGAILTPAPTLN